MYSILADDIKKERGDSPFNMAMLYYIRLSELLNAKDRAAINHDFLTWYTCLKQIYNNIYWNIKKEKIENEKINELFTDVLKFLSTQYPNNRSCASKMKDMVNAKVRVNLELIDQRLMVLMDSKKMIFPRIDNVVGLEKVREQYKLDEVK